VLAANHDDPRVRVETTAMIADRLEGKPTPAQFVQQPRDVIIYTNGDIVPAPLRPPAQASWAGFRRARYPRRFGRG